MYRVKFNEGGEAERIVLSYYNSISFAFIELCGRSYGGGVLEVLPGEIGNIMVPKLNNVSVEQIKYILQRIDKIVRVGENIEKALDIVDNEVLVDELKFDVELYEKTRVIWRKLQTRG